MGSFCPIEQRPGAGIYKAELWAETTSRGWGEIKGRKRGMFLKEIDKYKDS